MFHDNILLHLRKKKDGEGRYLWQSGANEGVPDTINAFPYFINQDMDGTLTSGSVSMLFGNLKAHKIRQVRGIRLHHLKERYRDTDQEGFLAYMWGDSMLANAVNSPVKTLTQL